ncbi:hypothetical protein Tco_0426825, partial [Tanacetum coccineum]
RSPAKGGDSEIGGDGDGVVMVRSLSTFAFGGRDMEVWGRTVILAPMVMSVEGGDITSYVPSGGKTDSSTGIKVVESAEAKCSSSSLSSSSSSSSSSSLASSLDESPSSSSPSSPPSIG